MTATTIDVQGIAKTYRIGHLQDAYGTLRDSITHGTRRMLRKEHVAKYDEIWALSDVTFAVEEGEVLGIIGPNGAGKSTLLKILTRITPPTAGSAEIRGRVGSLLEVGTGFHPELTGRENIFLNGTILGMTRGEIKAKLSDIVEFSGVEKFIDTPVKRYSSGMYVRLAFSIAAHLEPEVLLVDEVLAVGDAEFQRRCLGRMEELSKAGRTVLFVSHNMQVMARLCDRAILIEGGRISLDGASEEVVAHYLQTVSGSGSRRVWSDPETAPGSKWARLREARVVDEAGRLLHAVDVRQPIGIEVSFTILRQQFAAFPKIKVFSREGDVAFNAMDTRPVWSEPAPPGDYTATAWIPGDLLNEGLYTVDVEVASLGHVGMSKLVPLATGSDALSFHVHDAGDGDSSKGRFVGQFRGAVRPMLEWTGEQT